MPRLRDTITVVRHVGPWGFLMRIQKQIYKDDSLTWASSIAYAWLFAIFPFLVFLFTLIPLVVSYIPQAQMDPLDQRVGETLRQALPAETAATVKGILDDVLTRPRKGVMAMGLLLALWASSGGMATTMAAINRAYDVEDDRPFYLQRPLAMLLVAITSTLVLGVLILLPVGGYLTQWLAGLVDQQGLRIGTPLIWLWNVVRWTISIPMMLMVLALLYRFGTRIRLPFRLFTPGSVFTVAGWLLVGWGVRMYIDRFAKYDVTYGAAAGIVVLMFVMYLNAIVLLVGAQINSEIDFALADMGLKSDCVRPTAKPEKK